MQQSMVQATKLVVVDIHNYVQDTILIEIQI